MLKLISTMVTKYWKEIILLSTLLTLFLGYLASGLKINTDLTVLLPQNDSYSQKYRELFSSELVEDTCIIVIETKGDKEENLLCASEIKTKLEKMVDIVKFIKKTDTVSMMGPTGVLLTNSDVFEKLSSTFAFSRFLIENPAAVDFSIVRQAGMSYNRVSNTFKELVYMESIEKFVLQSQDNKVIVLTAVLTKPSIDIDFGKNASALIRKSIREITDIYGFSFGLTGGYQTAIDTNDVISRDFLITTFISLLGVTLLFFLAYGNFLITLSVFLSLIVGGVLSLGLFNVLFGSLEFTSSFVIALLLGLGIDFGIHISNRAVEEIKKIEPRFNILLGKEKRPIFQAAVKKSIESSGRSIFVGAITTIAAFMSMTLVDSPGLRRIGYMSGLGIFIFFLVMLCILPTILIFFSPAIKIKKDNKRSFNFFYGIFLLFEKKFSKTLSLVTLAVTCILIIFAINAFINFNYTPAELVPKNIESLRMMDVMSSHKMISSINDSVIAFVDEPEKLYSADQTLKDRSKFIISVTSLASYIPESIVKTFDKFKLETINVLQNTQSAFTVILLKKLRIYNDLDDLIKILNVSANFSEFLENIFDTKILPKEAKNFFTANVNGELKYKIYAETSSEIWMNNELPNFVNDLSRAGFDFFGYSVLYYQVMNLVINSIIFAVLLSGVIIGIMVILSLRNFSDSVVVLLSLIISIILVFSVVYLLGFRLNFMTMLALPLLMGMGIDAPIHLVHRLREEEKENADNNKEQFFKNVITGTGKAITLSSFTTAMAFISFAFASSPILKEFGYVLAIGIMINWIVTFLWVLGIRAVLNRKKVGIG